MSEISPRPCTDGSTILPHRLHSPPVLLLLFLIGLPVLHVLQPWHELVPAPWCLLGTVPIAAGIALNLVADRRFTEHGVSVKPHASPRVLITAGPFRFSRNPMYLGFGLIIAGVAVLLGSAIPLFAAASFFPIADRLYIRPEEDRLGAAFGRAWTEYRARVRRWI